MTRHDAIVIGTGQPALRWPGALRRLAGASPSSSARPSGGLFGSAILGQLFDRFGWAACVAGMGAALAVAAVLARHLRLAAEDPPAQATIAITKL
jgi:hypothetical protein